MTLEPTEAPLWIFDELDKNIRILNDKLDLLERTLKVKRFVYDPIDPEERPTLKRIRECIQMLNILEKGEEEIARHVIHELKYITHIIGDAPCRVCGANYKPFEYILEYKCPVCKRVWIRRVAYNKATLEFFINQLEKKENIVMYKGKKYGPLYCPQCIEEIIEPPKSKQPGIKKALHVTLERKITFVSRQYYPYPEAFALVAIKCRNPECNFRDRKWFPAWKPDENKYDIELTSKNEYKAFINRECPKCHSEIEYSREFIDADKVTEDYRARWGLPYPKKGKIVDPPPESGVKKRYYMAIYHLEEEYNTGRISLELITKLYLQKLLDFYEANLHNRDVLANIFPYLNEFVDNLEMMLQTFRTSITKPPPTTVVVDGDLLMKIVEIANTIIGICDWLFPSYIPQLVEMYGHIITVKYLEFKKAVNDLEQWCEDINIETTETGVTKRLEMEMGPLLQRIQQIRVRLPNIHGMAMAIKGIIMDKLFVSRRELELRLATMKALGKLGPITPSEKMPMRDIVLGHLSLNPDRTFTVKELLLEIGLPTTPKNESKMRALLNSLVKEGLVNKVDKGAYKLA